MEVKLINEINPNFNTIEQILFNRGIAAEDMEDFSEMERELKK